jgi:hypothetical protein
VAKANDFTADTILLITERVEGEGGGQYIVGGVKHEVELVEANEQLDVANGKWVVSDGALVYVPGRILKKKAMVSMSPTARWLAVPLAAVVAGAWRTTEIGMGLTWWGSGLHGCSHKVGI